MKENPYKRLPPIERTPDGSIYRLSLIHIYASMRRHNFLEKIHFIYDFIRRYMKILRKVPIM